MLKTITVMTLLRTICVETSKHPINDWERAASSILLGIDSIIRPFSNNITDIKTKTEEYVRNRLDMVFDGCKNKIPNTTLDSGFKHTEAFFESAISSDKVIEILKTDSNFKLETNGVAKEDAIKMIYASEVYRILLDKEAIPGTNISGKQTISLNGMIDHLFKSMYILFGKDTFEGSKDIRGFIKGILDIRKTLNGFLERCYVANGTFKMIDEMDFQQRLTQTVQLIEALFQSLESSIKNGKFDKNPKPIERDKYLNFYNLSKIVKMMLLLMPNYLNSLKTSESSRLWDWHSITISYSHRIANRLIFFAVPRDKMNNFLSSFRNGEGLDVFSIFDDDFKLVSNPQDFYNSMVNISKINDDESGTKKGTGDPTDNPWYTSTEFIISMVVICILIVGVLVYYSKNKNN